MLKPDFFKAKHTKAVDNADATSGKNGSNNAVDATKNAHQNIFPALIQITGQKTLFDIATNLAKQIIQLTSATLVCVVEVPNSHQTSDIKITASYDNTQRTPSLSEVRQLIRQSAKDWLQPCIEHKRPIEITVKSGFLWTLPILLDKASTTKYIVLVSSKYDSLMDKQLISGVTQIAQNIMDTTFESERDSLTALLNRKSLSNALNSIINNTIQAITTPTLDTSLPSEERRSLSSQDTQASEPHYWLGLIDIDYFKEINDKFGHLFGDDVILTVATLLQKNFREEDLIYRYGGEEFLVIAACKNKTSALAIFERLRLTIAEQSFGKANNITISIGIVQISSTEVPTTIIGHADQALYYAKAHGRNQLHCYEDLIYQGKINQPIIESDIEFF